ncbi:DNA-binding NarL/FixJ family response regulator [Chryseobacterium defluvii]|uniref:DNA-binding NarL/FixJ family response regulator n=1 Tax=Chryseobacterium defluvii TaxID=160396 RepID=A0A840KFD2_9FLAO|nr:response regulator transcription factor [Chryseobacterium defluvii]MBB4808279.1 DNA-binding NarL/FixJ family response regulator [Chryseobacterium defluvii]
MIRVAIVDDHQMFIEGLVAVLSKQENIQILFTENDTKSAIKRLRDQTPDLLITDIAMPDINGLELIRTVKRSYPNIKILVISMFNNLQSYEEMDGYLLKETGLSELLDAIYKIVYEDGKYFVNSEKEISHFEYNKNIVGKREREIIQLIAEEYTTEEIANKLFLSKNTVETHRRNIFIKLQVNNIAGLVRVAIQLGIVK